MREELVASVAGEGEEVSVARDVVVLDLLAVRQLGGHGDVDQEEN